VVISSFIAGPGGTTNNNVVEGNFIGTDVTGTKHLGNAREGILIEGATGEEANFNLIGGTVNGAGNTIAFNGAAGVAVIDASGTGGLNSIGNSIRGNAIFANTGLGIALGDEFTVTPNSPGGPHTGPNHQQNLPVLTGARSDGPNTDIQGLLNSTPNAGFVLDFYASPPDGSSQAYVGSRAVVTDNNGNALFNVLLGTVVPSGWSLTATATATASAPYGDTSEFASPVSVIGLPAITLGPAGLPDATAGAGYSQMLTAGGGAGAPYTFAVTAGALPQGFTLSSSGVLSGSSTTAGTSSFTITAADSTGFTGSQAFTFTVNPATATHFVISGPAGVTRGTAFGITVTAYDAFGNVATGYRGTVKFQSSDGSATLPGKYTFTASDNGVHTFTGLVLKKKGTQTITVFDAANTILGTISIDVL
jgi:titin